MLLLETKYLGTVPISEGDVFDFPEGLPGFLQEKSFVLMNVPGRDLLLLQSLSTKDLCFVALPVSKVDPKYELSVSFEDLTLLGLDATRQPEMGPEVGVLILLVMRSGGLAEGNLLAPVVINLANRRAVQAVRCDSRYQHAYPVREMEGSKC